MNSLPQPPIPTRTTAHLILRPFTDDDAGPLHRVMSDPEAMRYFPNPDLPSRIRVARLIRAQLEHWEEHGYGWWAVCAADFGATSQRSPLIGWAGLQYLAETDEVEVGYLLDKGYWGRGWASEAARESVRFGLEELGLETIIGVVHPENRASQRVLEKAGLVFVERANYFGMEVCRYQIERTHGDGACAV